MNVPTKQQVEVVVAELIKSFGCNLYYGDVLFHVDSRFPGMTDAEFDSIRSMMSEVTETARSAELHRVWG